VSFLRPCKFELVACIVCGIVGVGAAIFVQNLPTTGDKKRKSKSGDLLLPTTRAGGWLPMWGVFV
jgi:hypothetical protein